ncbi:hypothetical protein SAMN05660841_04087 [Sphingobacterium nematocida]|uniref:Fibronectin type-III domain-containing protein n=1 Tax=Sphingobacterium nematocida TaxID=1513896 RepID=A0A1T5GI20_9SPHI|nr:hypothetical protein [Sphingobacterium nematocida]SKC08041.1 hypothetical protein SAMN05660841_04087 [Sphingobacterium nematocida]
MSFLMKNPIHFLFILLFLCACQKGEEFNYQHQNVKAITSLTPSKVSRNTSILEGKVNTINKSKLTEVGFEYGVSNRDNDLTMSVIHNDKRDTGLFSIEITDLIPRTTYYYRAYAKNSNGTAYGEILSFTTSAGSSAIVNTKEATEITRTTASITGVITDNGGYKVIQRGICYSNTTSSPTIANTRVDVAEDTPNFTSNLTNLLASTKYYTRAYAITSYGTTYGNVVTFTTNQAILATGLTTSNATAITFNSATISGQITTDNNSPITARGFCYSTSSTQPTVSNGTVIQSGAGVGAFSSSLSNLASNTTYYIRSYATNTAGTAYGNVVSFKTNLPSLPSSVIVNYVSSISMNSALSNSSVGSAGGGIITSRGVCFSSSTSSPSLTNGTVLTAGTGIGTFSLSLTGLVPSTTYYIRSYATNEAGTTYSTVYTFRTNSPSLPSGVIANSSSSITQNTALLGGSISNAGGGTILQRGVVMSSSASVPTLTNGTVLTSGSGTGSFSLTASGLIPSTTYYYRVYATNETGTSYSSVQSFTTKYPSPPEGVVTISVAAQSGNAALGKGSVASDGGATVTSRGFVYSSSTSSPTISNGSRLQVGSGTGSFEANLTGLTRGTYYYVRAYATNSRGTVYGSVITFRTLL